MRNYKKKTQRGTIPEDVYIRASKEVLENKKSLRTVAADYGVNFMTLQRYCKKVKMQGSREENFRNHMLTSF